MKKTLIILALAMVSFANAQKGSILLAGNIGFSSSKNDAIATENKMNTLSFNPKVGYQVNDHWTFGIEASVSMDKNETSSFNGFTTTTTETKNDGFAVGPFARYSKALSEIFSIYADMGVGMQSNKVTNDNGFGSTSVKADGIYVGITPAVFINLKKNFGLNFSIGGLGYETLNYDGVGGADTNSINFDFGQTVNVGISKNF